MSSGVYSRATSSPEAVMNFPGRSGVVVNARCSVVSSHLSRAWAMSVSLDLSYMRVTSYVSRWPLFCPTLFNKELANGFKGFCIVRVNRITRDRQDVRQERRAVCAVYI